jgi:hypothetical protein
METDIQQDPRQKSKYGSAPFMTPKEKQISFYNRYFVFKKISSVDVEDVYQSVTGVSVFQEKMNRRDTLAAQLAASQMMVEEGEGEGEGKGRDQGKKTYRPTKDAELKLLKEKEKSMGLSAVELESSDTRLSNLFGSKTKEKLVKDKGKSKGAEAGVSAEAGVGVKGYSDKDLEKLDKSAPITLKKKSSLTPVKLPESGVVAVEPGAAASIIEKSKLGLKESSAKLAAEKKKSEKASAAVEASGEASAASAGPAAQGDSEKPKEKKTSTKLGSIRLNPSAIASSLSKSKKDEK